MSKDSSKQSDSDSSSLSEAPTGQKDSLRSFISTLASFSGDLSALTCPSFLLSSVSLLEYSQYWGDHPKLFASISAGATPEDRLLNCTRWFISTLYGSYSSRSTTAGLEKKPYNPILGEQYFAQWTGDIETGDTILIAEQVSHHPPIMGFHLENKKAGVVLEGHCGQKSRFAMPAGIDVSQTGHAILRLPCHNNETYLITLPSLQVRGIVTGRPSVELAGSTYIVSSAGQIATIEYSTKGYFSGERHSFKAVLKAVPNFWDDEDDDDDDENDYDDTPFYTAQGVWSGVSNYAVGNGSTKKGSSGSKLFFDSQLDISLAPELKPLAEMGSLESQKLWATVTQAINNKDFSTASREKSQIEDAQRVLAKARKEKRETQADALKLFVLVDEDADDTGKAFQKLKETLINIADSKAIREDEAKPHWRLRT
ncbi:glycerol ethanol, ferric requiring protein [Mortierella claussenii]|nr:glycerol ethanol, ferric requiring protein [Mortierella claussenii]